MSAGASADVVVAGSGVVGASIAYHLARRGVRVAVVDRARPPAGATASGASAGGVRAQGRTDGELPLAVEALARWPSLAAELGADLGYRRDGMTVCIDDPALLPALARRMERERAAGVDVRLVEGATLHRLVPGLSERMVAASYAPGDGHADPLRTTRAFARAAARLGADVRYACALTALRLEGGRVAAAVTEQGEIACAAVVLAAGPWTGALAARLGYDLPLRAGCIQMFVTAPMPHRLDQVLAWVGQGISLKQQTTGGYLLGGGWPGEGDVEGYRADVRVESVARSADVAVRLFPPLAGAALLRAWVGFESWGPEDEPLIGPLQGPTGVWVAAGFSGHGFAISPAVGSRLAEWLESGQRPSSLAPFDAQRYDGATGARKAGGEA